MPTEKGKVEEADEFQTSNGKDMYKLVVNGEDHSNFGRVPEGVSEGDTVKIQYEKNNGFRNIEDVEVVEEGEAQKHDTQMSRQKPIEAIGRIYQGNPPSDETEFRQFKVLLKELSHFSKTGEFKIEPEDLEMEMHDIRQFIEDFNENQQEIMEALKEEGVIEE